MRRNEERRSVTPGKPEKPIREPLRTRRVGTFAEEGELLHLSHNRDDLFLIAGWYLLITRRDRG